MIILQMLTANFWTIYYLLHIMEKNGDDTGSIWFALLKVMDMKETH